MWSRDCERAVGWVLLSWEQVMADVVATLGLRGILHEKGSWSDAAVMGAGHC